MADILHTFSILASSVKRYLRIDFQYKFLIITDAIWLLLDIVAFAFLGGFLDEKTSAEELGLNGIDMVTFMLLGVLFWAFFHRSYEDTVNTIPEEASRGTIGFLVTNNVGIGILLLSRNIASTIKTTLIALVTIVPVLVVVYPAVAGITTFTEGSGPDPFEGEGSDIQVVVGKDVTLIPNSTLSKAEYISRVHDGGVGCEWQNVRWDYLEENGTVKLFVRTSNEVPASNQSKNYQTLSEWMGGAENGWMEIKGNGTVPGEKTNRYLQYKLVFTNLTGGKPPMVKEVTITYKDPLIGFVDPVRDFTLMIICFLLSWMFIITISVLISTLNIIFKRITPFAVMILYGLKILSGYYFPVEAISIEGVPEMVKGIPITSGLYLVRGLMSGHPNNVAGYLQNLVVGTIIMAVVALVFLIILQRKSQKWGTLEFY